MAVALLCRTVLDANYDSTVSVGTNAGLFDATAGAPKYVSIVAGMLLLRMSRLANAPLALRPTARVSRRIHQCGSSVLAEIRARTFVSGGLASAPW